MTRGEQIVRLLTDRPHAVGAEIGTRDGETSLALLMGLPGLAKLWCIDPHEEYPDYVASEGMRQNWHDSIWSIFAHRLAPVWNRVYALRTTSVLAERVVEDASLDFIFIDGCHEYGYVKEDILLWVPKVKPGGLIIGHDYKGKPGVRAAVDEAFLDVAVGADDTWYLYKEGV